MLVAQDLNRRFKPAQSQFAGRVWQGLAEIEVSAY
jgi:hypothetical protein